MTTEKKRRLGAERDAYEKILSELKALNLKTPKRGWIKAIREMLGITVSELGQKSNLDPTTITRLEGNEVKDSITLRSLRKLAESLQCDLVYGFVPKKPLKDLLEDKAKSIVKKDAKRSELTKLLKELELEG